MKRKSTFGSVLPILLLALASPLRARAAGLDIQTRAVGLSETDAKTLIAILLDGPELRPRLEGRRIRVLGFDAAETAPAKETEGGASTSFVLDLYDYTADQAIEVQGDLSRMNVTRIGEPTRVIEPSPEEMNEAIQTIRTDRHFGDPQLLGRWHPYSAMPGIIPTSQGRVIAVGILPESNSPLHHEIVGVNLASGRILRYPNGAPPTTLANERACAPPTAGQGVTGRGVQGSADVVVAKAGQTLWNFQVVRPAASSAPKGSGIDLRNIRYKGKLLLAQLHVPILNVKYDRNVCGPYRDWQYAESAFQVNGGTSLSGGIIRTPTPARTIFESGSDTGNFRGVAIYADGPETVLVTELEAGWYRYKAEYRFHEDGSIRPRWGFAAIQDSCTCNLHFHNAYWRMDFDVAGNRQNRVETWDGTRWNLVSKEARQFRNASLQKWRISDPITGSAYEVIPGEKDSTADEFGRGDAWILAYHPGEMDDSSVTGSAQVALSSFVNGESVDNQDLVFWYGAHFTHQFDQDPRHDDEGHIVGPTIRPVQW